MPKISVIVPVYNVEKFLNRCLESIRNQSFDDIEIILVNDGSTDKSGEICEYFKKIDSRIITIHQKNKGLAAARNEGLKNSKGNYIAFVDSDDYIDKDMYIVLFELLEKSDNKNLIVSGIDIITYDNEINIKPTFSREIEYLNKEEVIKRFLFRYSAPSIGVCNKLFHRSLFDDIRFPDGMINEDSIVLAKIYKRSDGLILTNQAVYFYFQRQGSITKSSFKDRSDDYIIMSQKVREELISLDYGFIEEGCNVNLLYAYREKLMNQVRYKFEKKEFNKTLKNYRNTFKLVIRTKSLKKMVKIKLILIYISPKFFNLLKKYCNN